MTSIPTGVGRFRSTDPGSWLPKIAVSLIDRAGEAYDVAAAKVGERVVRRSVAGHVVELRVAGEQLLRVLTEVLPAAGDGEPVLRVRAWDHAATGVAYPLTSEELGDMQAWRRHGPWVEVDSAGPLVMHQPYEDVVGILDGDEAIFFTDDAAELPLWERAAPLLHLFHWWLAELGAFVIHASAVGVREAGALLVGPSGSGKSTSAMACVGSSLGWVGDDYTAVEMGEVTRAKRLFLAAKLDRSQVSRALAGVAHPPWLANQDHPEDEKALLVMDESSVPEEVELRAVLLPRVGPGAEHRVLPVAPGRALAALAPSSILQLPGSGSKHLAVMRKLCMDLPGYILEIGAAADPRTLPDVIAGVIGR